jgi:hypothetical protein
MKFYDYYLNIVSNFYLAKEQLTLENNLNFSAQSHQSIFGQNECNI